MWELIKQYNVETRSFRAPLRQKRWLRLSPAGSSWIIINCIGEKAQKIRSFGSSLLIDSYHYHTAETRDIILDMCPLFNLNGAQTKLVEDSALLSNTKFYSFLAPYTVFSNGNVLLLKLSIPLFLQFFVKFFRTRNLIYQYCYFYNKRRLVSYCYSLPLLKQQFLPITLKYFPFSFCLFVQQVTVLFFLFSGVGRFCNFLATCLVKTRYTNL